MASTLIDNVIRYMVQQNIAKMHPMSWLALVQAMGSPRRLENVRSSVHGS